MTDSAAPCIHCGQNNVQRTPDGGTYCPDCTLRGTPKNAATPLDLPGDLNDLLTNEQRQQMNDDLAALARLRRQVEAEGRDIPLA